MRRTARFDVVALQSYTDAQVEFLASVEGQYPEGTPLAEVVADHAEEIAALADE